MYDGWRFFIVHLQDCLIGIIGHPDGPLDFAAMRRDGLFYQEMIYLIGIIPMQITDICFEMEPSLSRP